jgi:ribose transport system ATP-binding protein
MNVKGEQPPVRMKAPRLEFNHLSKTFGATRALKDLSLVVNRAEIHGLVGQNGSGKSTLIKVLAGYYEPDAGSELRIDGNPVRLPLKPGEYLQFGINFVHQDLALIPSLTVLENLRAQDLCLKGGWYISWKNEVQAARDLLTQFNLDLDPLTKIEDVAVGTRALLAIVRATDAMQRTRGDGQGGLLILDEPTAFLSGTDVKRLFALIRQIKGQGASVIFVSHDIDEVLEITDRVTVIRDGALIATLSTIEATKEILIEKIVGHPLPAKDAITNQSEGSGNLPPKIVVKDLSGSYVRGVSFEIREREIIGLTGLHGSGFNDVPSLLFGAQPALTGNLTIHGRTFQLAGMTPWKALEAQVVLIPVDRRGGGLVEDLTIVENVSLPVLKEFNPWRLEHGKLKSRTATLIRDFDVRPSNTENQVRNLSGGNQQKVLLAKWLQTHPELILLDEPTQGVDVGAREQIYKVLQSQAASGTMILCASSDYEELAILCDRVLIFSSGRIVGELQGTQLTKENIAQRIHLD